MKKNYFMLAGLISLVCVSIPRTSFADPLDLREKLGTIEEIRYSDPMKESNVLAEVDVVDGLGKKLTVKITLDTTIRDPDWHIAQVTYLTKGTKVKATFKITEEGSNLAQDIHILN